MAANAGGYDVGLEEEHEMNSEHADDRAPTVDQRGEMETEDFPKTRDDFEAEDDESESSGDDLDDEAIVGK